MKIEKIVPSENQWIDVTAKICGDVTVGCSETAEILRSAIKSADAVKADHANLAAITAKLEVDIADVALATSEAQSLSLSAKDKLESGNRTIRVSMESFSEMIVLINHLGTHITGFVSAMEQVKQVSQTIDKIARTTNMLALNAAIEAEKAGEAGATFAIVASEVKKLAFDTRSAAIEITGTVNSLSDEASKFVEQIEAGTANSNAAQSQYADLQSLLSGVSEIVTNVGEYNNEIASSTSAIHHSLSDSHTVREMVAQSNSEMHHLLENAHIKINALEFESNRMFDNIVHSGLSPDDQKFAAIAVIKGAELAQLTEAAIASGELRIEDLFDNDLQLIGGSNPPRYKSRMTNWADAKWRPYFDSIYDNGLVLTSVVCSRFDGYLPTHISAFSKMPNGDPAHELRYCRNGRMITSDLELKANASKQDYLAALYRQDGDGKQGILMRNIYVPLRINGRHWGEFEIAYIL